MTTAQPPAPTARRRTTRPSLADLDAQIAEAERTTVVMWRGRRIALEAVPGRIAELSDRVQRGLLYAGWGDALEAINPLREARLTARVAAAGGDLIAETAGRRGDPTALAASLQQFLAESETVYFAALRRFLALIDIEQGDATIADLWNVQRGASWHHWFEAARLDRALAESFGAAGAAASSKGGVEWATAATRLAAATRASYPAPTGVGRARPDPVIAGALEALASALLADADWLATELGMTGDDLAGFADFAAFMRLWRLRRDTALLHYELRLYRTTDPDLQRGYYAGMVGLLTGVSVLEAEYLKAVDVPFASAERLRAEILAGMASEALRAQHGPAWWRGEAAHAELRELGTKRNLSDVVARLGYDHLDWRPVLRQIRTQLIGEMSGYGGPNITTRAGTRKV